MAKDKDCVPNKSMILVVGYKCNPHSTHYPTVIVYGAYETLTEAQQRQNHLSVIPPMNGTSVRHGRYVTWLKEMSMGDSECDIRTNFLKPVSLNESDSQ